MKTQAILLFACGFATLVTAGTPDSEDTKSTAAAVTVQPNPTVSPSPQPSGNASLLLAKRPDVEKRCAGDDDYCPSTGFIEPCDVSCGDFKKDVKCGMGSWLEKITDPLNSDRMDAYVACIQSCRKENGLNRLIFYKGKYLDMSLEEYDEWIRNGADSKSAASAAAASTTTEAEATVTVWTNLATTNQPPPSVKAGAKTTSKVTANTTSWDDKVKSTSFQTSFRTVSSSAPQASGSVLLGERSTTEADCHHKARGQQKCRTKCG